MADTYERGLPKDWSAILWNPPIHRAASGAYVDAVADTVVNYASGSEYREQMLGPDGYQSRVVRKGVLFQHIANSREWDYKVGLGDYQVKGSGRGSKRYGFRFHYNPSMIRHGLGVNNTGVNPAVILSGAAQSAPITPGDSPATVAFSVYLNRIEDMLLLAPKSVSRDDTYADAIAAWNRQLEKAYANNNVDRVRDLLSNKPKKSQFQFGRQQTLPLQQEIEYFYGKKMSDDDLIRLYERGTGYDLEFLFRTMLGRPWKTLLRGRTADVGVAFGVPLVLDFNAGASPGGVRHGQRYLGRVMNVSYNHLSFNRRMVPMWTEVAIDFMRYPDAIEAVSDVGSSNYSEETLTEQPYVSPTAADRDARLSDDGSLGVIGQTNWSSSGPLSPAAVEGGSTVQTPWFPAGIQPPTAQTSPDPGAGLDWWNIE